MRALESTVHVAYLVAFGRHIDHDEAVSTAERQVRVSFPKLMHHVYLLVTNKVNARGDDEAAREYYQRLASLFLKHHSIPIPLKSSE